MASLPSETGKSIRSSFFRDPTSESDGSAGGSNSAASGSADEESSGTSLSSTGLPGVGEEDNQNLHLYGDLFDSTYKNLPRRHAKKLTEVSEKLLEVDPEERDELLDRFLSIISDRAKGTSSHYAKTYDEIEIIGSGASGIVCKCKHLIDGKLYAIKKIPYVKQQELISASREICILAKLEHEHVVKYQESWLEDDFPPSWDDFLVNLPTDHGFDTRRAIVGVVYIKMEHCLSTLQPQGDRTWLSLHQIALGLQHIHAAKIIHCDLSLKNIFVDAHGKIKIGDFGLALEVSGQDGQGGTQSSGNKGNPYYRAPELDKDPATVTFKTDIYSLGMIATELIGGVSHAYEYDRWCASQDARRGVFPSGMSCEDEELILKMLDADPVRRPSVEELLADPRMNQRVGEEDDVKEPDEERQK